MKQSLAIAPDQFYAFGHLLKFLRRRVSVTQRELGIAVGYSDTQISRMSRASVCPTRPPSPPASSRPCRLNRSLTGQTPAGSGGNGRRMSNPRRRLPGRPRLAARPHRPRPAHRTAGRVAGAQGALAAGGAGPRPSGADFGRTGIGKTRLAREVQELARSEGAVVLGGGCYEFEAVAPYLPFVEGLREWVAAQGEAALREQLGAAAPELARLIPEIEARLGPLPSNPSLPLDEERLRLFDNLARFLQSLGSAHGLLIFLDDLHWPTRAC